MESCEAMDHFKHHDDSDGDGGGKHHDHVLCSSSS